MWPRSLDCGFCHRLVGAYGWAARRGGGRGERRVGAAAAAAEDEEDEEGRRRRTRRSALFGIGVRRRRKDVRRQSHSRATAVTGARTSTFFFTGRPCRGRLSHFLSLSLSLSLCRPSTRAARGFRACPTRAARARVEQNGRRRRGGAQGVGRAHPVRLHLVPAGQGQLAPAGSHLRTGASLFIIMDGAAGSARARARAYTLAWTATCSHTAPPVRS